MITTMGTITITMITITRNMTKEIQKNNFAAINDPPLKALVLAGTGDARELCLRALANGIEPVATVVTHEAATTYRELNIKVHTGRMRAITMTDLAMREGIEVIIDASHPFANQASEEAIKTSKILHAPYIRYERPETKIDPEELFPDLDPKKMISFVADEREAIGVILEKIKEHRKSQTILFPGKPRLTIFLATGAKTLKTFAEALLPEKDIRMLIRLLPRCENLSLCEKLGIEPKNIIAMQGPFSEEFNRALMKNFDARLLVTKESGAEGSTREKVYAAASLGIPVIMIRRPPMEYPNLCASIDEAVALAIQLARPNLHNTLHNNLHTLKETP